MNRAPDPEAGPRTYSRGDPFVSGETVTPGRFECLACGAVHVVPDATVANLPVCPRCHAEQWRAAGGHAGQRGQVASERGECGEDQRTVHESE